MKKVHGKYIRLTEQDLRRIVQEQIQVILEYKQPRKKLVNEASNYVCQLVMHWCAIRFFKKTGLETSDINHWKSEVNSLMGAIACIKLKGTMNEFETRKCAIAEGFEDYDVLTDKNSIFNLCVAKLGCEDVDVEGFEQEINETVDECFGEIQHIIDLMASGDTMKILKYVRGL
jgi:hypothetical protein